MLNAACLIAALALSGWAGESLAADDDRPVRIHKVALAGCKKRTCLTPERCSKIPCQTIRSIMRVKKTPWYLIRPKEDGFDEFFAVDDARRIKLFYRSKGYYGAKVPPPDITDDKRGRGKVITYNIVEGQPVIVKKIDPQFADGMHEEDDLETMTSLVPFEVGDVFELEPYQKAAKAMETYYKDDGFFKARVERKAIVDPDPDKLRAEVFYIITKGKRYKIGDIYIKGTSEPEVVKRALAVKEEDRYRKNEVLDDQRRVQGLPIYQSVRVTEEADDETLRVDLTIRVKEADPQMIKLGVGYGSEEGFRAQILYRHVNFLGGARQFTASARWSALLEREEVSIVQPNVRTPGDFISLTMRREFEHEESYDHESISLIPTYHMVLTDYLRMDVIYIFEQNLTSNIEDALEIRKEDLAREGLLSATAVRLNWADVDNPLDTRRGARAAIYGEYGGGALGGVFPYYKIEAEARGYYPLYPFGKPEGERGVSPLVGAILGRIGYAEPTGDLDQIPVFKRFWSGGTGSVRGYERRQLGPLDNDGDPIGGARMMEGSIELRFPIYNEFGGVVFMDGGWVWLEDDPYDFDDIMYGAGLGLRWNTPIGPVSIDVGFPLTGRDEYPDAQLHVNIGHAF